MIDIIFINMMVSL